MCGGRGLPLPLAMLGEIQLTLPIAARSPAPRPGRRACRTPRRGLGRPFFRGGNNGKRDAPMFFTFPEAARWNAERQAVEFGVEIGEYHGVVRVPRRVFQRLPPERPTPERCVEAYYLQRTRSEGIAERTLSGAPIDRGWEYRDQRAGLRPSTRWGRCRSPGSVSIRPRLCENSRVQFARRKFFSIWSI